MSLTLYYHPLASYCHKVMVALHELGLDAERKLINLGAEADRAQLQALWPMTKFPVLRDQARGQDVPESSIIIEYLDRHYGPAGRLLPADPDGALDVRLWDRVFDNYVQGPMQEIVAAHFSGGKDNSARLATLATAYRMIDARMAGRSWVAGEAFSMADCAAVPALFYACTLSPFPDDCVHLAAYFERLMARPSVQKTLEEARPYFDMYPFADAIAQRFRQA
ncbi:glutathione S-transferase family protein [Massilia sp. CF038]|uniref:glutathione S-transferase family protein n=1 Tax=Massilia sp. CF038 TaxID=1881045 RepID=UPI000915BDB4|nr:glutathione S-transferase family protein [Massilia sp. CF038]SHG54008.1 glutathione S-transferase [Massilia sp. CF038]